MNSTGRPTRYGDEPVPPGAVDTGLRRGLLAVILFGSIGTFVELLLLGHTEDWSQLLPLVLLGGSMLVTVAAWFVPGGGVLTAFRVMMWACVLSGVIGHWLHYSGNAEFEREMYPNLAGLELFWESMRSATPVLAPGTMTVIGLLGLIFAWPHRSTDHRGVPVSASSPKSQALNNDAEVS